MILFIHISQCHYQGPICTSGIVYQAVWFPSTNIVNLVSCYTYNQLTPNLKTSLKVTQLKEDACGWMHGCMDDGVCDNVCDVMS